MELSGLQNKIEKNTGFLYFSLVELAYLYEYHTVKSNEETRRLHSYDVD